MSKLITGPSMFAKHPGMYTDVVGNRATWEKNGSRALLVGKAGLVSSRLDATGGLTAGNSIDTRCASRRVQAWEHASKGAILQADASRDGGRAAEDDIECERNENTGFIISARARLVETDDASIRGMPEFRHVADFYADTADPDHQSREYYASVRDARLTLQQRNTEKVWMLYGEMARNVAGGRRVAESAHTQILLLQQLVGMAVRDGGVTPKSELKNFYAQEKLLQLLEADVRGHRHLEDATSKMKLGIGYGLWGVDDGNPRLGDGTQLNDDNNVSQRKVMNNWIELKSQAVLAEADASAFKLSKSVQSFRSAKSSRALKSPWKKQYNGKLSDEKKLAYDHMQEELRAFLRYNYGGALDNLDSYASGELKYRAGNTLIRTDHLRGFATSLNTMFNVENFGECTHGAYYGQLAVASGLLVRAGDGGSARPQDERPSNTAEQALVVHGLQDDQNPHLKQRSPHLQLLMAKALMRGEGVFQRKDLANDGHDPPAAYYAGGDYFIDREQLDGFERYNSLRDSGTDDRKEAVAEYRRSAAQILLKCASEGASTDTDVPASPGLPEAKSLYGRMLMGHPVAKELRGALPPQPGGCQAQEAEYRRLFGWRKASTIDKNLKKGLSAIYHPDQHKDTIRQTRKRALQCLYDAAYDGDCAAMASLIDVNLRGSRQMGINRDVVEAVRLIQEGMGQGMMYNPVFRGKMRELSEDWENPEIFRFRDQGSWFSNKFGGISWRIRTPQETKMGRLHDLCHFMHQYTHWGRNFLLFLRSFGECYYAQKDIKALRRSWGLNEDGTDIDQEEVIRQYNEDHDPETFNVLQVPGQLSHVTKERRQRMEGYRQAFSGYKASIDRIRTEMSYFSENPVADEIAGMIGERMFDSRGVRRKDDGLRRQSYGEVGKYLLPDANQLRTREGARYAKEWALSLMDRIEKRDLDLESVEAHALQRYKLKNMYISINERHTELMENKRRGLSSRDNLRVKEEHLRKCLRDAVDWRAHVPRLKKQTVTTTGGEVCQSWACRVKDAEYTIADGDIDRALVIEYFPEGRPAVLNEQGNGLLPEEVPIPLSVSAALSRELRPMRTPPPPPNHCFVAYLRAVGNQTDLREHLQAQGASIDPPLELQERHCVSLETEFNTFLAASEGEKRSYIAACEGMILSDKIPSDEQMYTMMRYLSLNPQLIGSAPDVDRATCLDNFSQYRGFCILSLLSAVLENRGNGTLCFGAVQDAGSVGILHPDANAGAKYPHSTQAWCKQIADEAIGIADSLIMSRRVPMEEFVLLQADALAQPDVPESTWYKYSDPTAAETSRATGTHQKCFQAMRQLCPQKTEAVPTMDSKLIKENQFNQIGSEAQRALKPFCKAGTQFRERFIPWFIDSGGTPNAIYNVVLNAPKGSTHSQLRMFQDTDLPQIPGYNSASQCLGGLPAPPEDYRFPICYIPSLDKERFSVASQTPEATVISMHAFFRNIIREPKIVGTVNLTNENWEPQGFFGTGNCRPLGADINPANRSIIMPYDKPGEYTNPDGHVLKLAYENGKNSKEVYPQDPSIFLTRMQFSFDDDGARAFFVLRYTSWVDKKIIGPNEMLNLVLAIRHFKERSGDDSSLIHIHCRAGIGRTGTLTTCLQMADLIDADKFECKDDLNFIRDMTVLQGKLSRGIGYVQTQTQLDMIGDFSYYYFALKQEHKKALLPTPLAALSKRRASIPVRAHVQGRLTILNNVPPPDMSMEKNGLYFAVNPLNLAELLGKNSTSKQKKIRQISYEASGNTQERLRNYVVEFTEKVGADEATAPRSLDDKVTWAESLFYAVNNSHLNPRYTNVSRMSSLILLQALHRSHGALLFHKNWNNFEVPLLGIPEIKLVGGEQLIIGSDKSPEIDHVNAQRCLNKHIDFADPNYSGEVASDLFYMLSLMENGKFEIDARCRGSLEVAMGLDHYRVVGTIICKMLDIPRPGSAGNDASPSYMKQWMSMLRRIDYREVDTPANFTSNICGKFYGAIGGFDSLCNELNTSHAGLRHPTTEFNPESQEALFSSSIPTERQLIEFYSAVHPLLRAYYSPAATGTTPNEGEITVQLQDAAYSYMSVADSGIARHLVDKDGSLIGQFFLPAVLLNPADPSGQCKLFNEPDDVPGAGGAVDFSRLSDPKMEATFLHVVGIHANIAGKIDAVRQALAMVAHHSPDAFHRNTALQYYRCIYGNKPDKIVRNIGLQS